MSIRMQLDPDGKTRPKLIQRTESQTLYFFNTHHTISDLGYSTPCWKWTGGVDAHGYGIISFQGKNVKAHRYSALLYHGTPNINNALACHKCDQPICVNPEHIYWGNHKSNVTDMMSRGRSVHPRGEMVFLAKLKPDSVLEIRRLRASGLSFRKIATLMGVTKSTIQGVIYGNTWRHVK